MVRDRFRRPSFSRAVRQRGAAAIFVAVSLIALLSAVGFALDLGQIYIARAELRKLAETGALSAATVSTGCINPDTDREQAASNAITAALNGAPGITPSFVFGDEIIAANGSRTLGPTRPDADFASAISVTLTRPLPPRIMPLFPLNNEGRLRATAQASRPADVSFDVGSTILRLDTSEIALLGPLLEALLPGLQPVAVGAAQLTNLLETELPLNAILSEAGAGSVQELLSIEVTLGRFLRMLEGAALRVGTAAAGQASATLQALANSAPATAAQPVGDLLGVSSGLPTAAVGASVNAYSFARTAILNSLPLDGVFAIPLGISIGGGTVSVDGLLTLGAFGSETGFGPVLRDEEENYLTRAANRELGLGLQLGVQLPGLGSLLDLTLQVEAARVQAELTEITCPNPYPNDIPTVTLEPEVDVAYLSLGPSNEDALIRLAGTEVLNLLGISCPALLGPVCNLLNQDLVQVALSAGPVAVSDDCRSEALPPFVGPFASSEAPDVAPVVQSYPSRECLLGGVSDALVELLDPSNLQVDVVLIGNSLLGDLINLPALELLLSNLLRNALEPLADELDDAIIGPLLAGLGINVAGADIAVTGFYVRPAQLFAIDPN